MSSQILGISARFKDDLSNNEFWKILVESGSLTTGMSTSRKSLGESLPEPVWRSSPKGMFLDGIDQFDREVFSVSPPSLVFSDPRQRIVLESVWNAIADAGIESSKLRGKRIGVFVAHDGWYLGSYSAGIVPDIDNQEFVVPGNDPCFLANRVSSIFDFNGPSMSIDSTCSGTLTALHMARVAIDNGECDFAVVAAVTLFLKPWAEGSITATPFESSRDQMQSFQNGADGYITSEGAGAIFVGSARNLEDEFGKIAEPYADVLATASNSGGKTASFAQPSEHSQVDLFSQLLESASLDASDISYIEAHGVATSTGDTIESNAIASVFGDRPVDNQCYISCVKPNLGHTHAASGIYGILKALLSMKHGVVPPIKGFNAANINNDIKQFDGIRFADEPISMNQSGLPMTSMVSGYGLSNVNSAVVLQHPGYEYTTLGANEPGSENSVQIPICLSATSTMQLRQCLSDLYKFAQQQLSIEKASHGEITPASHALAIVKAEKVSVAEAANSLRKVRSKFKVRWASVCSCWSELAEQIDEFLLSPDQLPWVGKYGQVVSDSSNTAIAIDELINHLPDALGETAVSGSQKLECESNKDLVHALREWLGGQELNWEERHSQNKYLARLPKYPLERKSYWIPEKYSVLANRKEKNQRYVEPQQRIDAVPTRKNNLDDAVVRDGTQLYKYQLLGSEFYLEDHQIQGQRILPAVMHLEIISKSLRSALNCSNVETVEFSDIAWERPLIVEKTECVEVTVSLQFTDTNNARESDITFAVTSMADDEEMLHSSGMAKLRAESEAEKVDIVSLMNRCNLGVQTQEQVYQLPDHLQLHLGAGLRGVRQVWLGDKEIVAKLRVPECVDEQFGLHPSILDPVLQIAFLSLAMRYLPEGALTIPFYLGSAKQHGDTSTDMWVHVRYANDSNPGDSVERLDVDLVDSIGYVVFEMRDFSFRQLDRLGSFVSDDVSTASIPQRLKQEVIENKEPGQDYGKIVINCMARHLAIDNSELSEQTSFENLGLDSILMKRITTDLEDSFGPLPKTLMFEYQTVGDLINGLLERQVPTLNQTTSTSTSTSGRTTTNSGHQQCVDRYSGDDDNECIAIVGISGQYPGSNSLREFWNVLLNGKDCISSVPKDRWDVSEYFNEGQFDVGHHHSQYGGFIDNVDMFDPLFFGISPREAIYMDPQERLILQHAWNSLEHAGYSKSSMQRSYAGATGVYVGAMYGQYQMLATDFDHSSRSDRLGFSSTLGSIANRVSYVMGFGGPSMVLDTQCSSSLTALHIASKDLLSRETGMALVGGVNLSLHPAKYLELSRRKFISHKGTCASFGEGGGGYIPSEGVGVVVLKRYSDAVSDGDEIHATIIGTAINHGGTTSGYTVPNPTAQAGVLSEALRSAEITSDKVNYIEAHGTGTVLGDPIEVAALSTSFPKQNISPQCYLGSVKSNIGHCESAAGMAGLTKILLQLKHKTIVPSIHSSVLNPNIEFDETRFTVPQSSTPWLAVPNEKDGTAKPLPRTAGLSSFGAGGANAHIVVQEAESPVNELSTQAQFTMPISAASREGLRTKLRELADFIADWQLSSTELIGSRKTTSPETQAEFRLLENNWLYRVSCTLHVGREQLSERIVFSVDTTSEWLKQIEIRLNIGTNTDISADSSNVYDDAAITDWLQDKSVDLVDIWGSRKISKIAIPVYPFKGERYWITDKLRKEENKQSKVDKKPINKTQTGLSILPDVEFSIAASSKIFQDHCVKGRPILPGAVAIRILLLACSHSIGVSESEVEHLKFRDITFIRPIKPTLDVVNIKVQLSHASRQCAEAGGYDNNIQSYELALSHHDNGVWHKCVSAMVDTNTSHSKQVQPLPNHLDKPCKANIISKESLYAAYDRLGIVFGQSFSRIESLSVDQDVVTVRLNVQEGAVFSTSTQQLEPCWLDSCLDAAFQASIALEPQVSGNSLDAIGRLGLPKSISELRFDSHWLNQPLSTVMCARNHDHNECDDRSVDMTLIDSQGNAHVWLTGFVVSSPVQPARAEIAEQEDFSESELLELTPEWKIEPYFESNKTHCPFTNAVFVALPKSKVSECVLERYRSAFGSRTKILILDDLDCDASSSMQRIFLETQETLKELINDDATLRCLQWCIPMSNSMSTPGGIDAFLYSVQKENPCIEKVQLILVDELLGRDPFELALQSASVANQNSGGCYRLFRNHIESLLYTCKVPKANTAVQDSDQLVWKDNGVYVLFGGGGALGRELAGDALLKSRNCRVVLLGRSPADSELQSILAESEGRLHYSQCDVANAVSVKAVLDDIRSVHGNIRGVMNLAGFISDKQFVNKHVDELAGVFTPKVDGAINIDSETANDRLDWFVCFGSVAGVCGNHGQSDYAFANGFQKSFMEHRANKVALGERSGSSLCISWPLMKNGGMNVSAAVAKRIEKNTGMISMGSTQMLSVLEKWIGSSECNVIVAEGNARKLYAWLNHPQIQAVANEPLSTGSQTVVKTAKEVDVVKPTSTSSRLVVANAFDEILGIPQHRLEIDVSIAKYGIDSVTTVEVLEYLEKQLPVKLSAADFYEHSTIERLSSFIDKKIATELSGDLRTITNSTTTSVDNETASTTSSRAPSNSSTIASNATEAVSAVVEKVVQAFHTILAIPLEKLKPNVPTNTFGIDSVSIAEIMQELKKSDIQTEAQDFYEFPCIEKLSNHIVESNDNLSFVSSNDVVAESTAISVADLESVGPKNQIEFAVPDKGQRNIAIVGMSGLYPGAQNLEQYWENIHNAEVSTGLVDEQRLALWSSSKEQSAAGAYGGFVSGVEQFDNELFDISNADAMRMDPQERKALELCYSALEDAGYSPFSISKNSESHANPVVGVYVGAMFNLYQLYQEEGLSALGGSHASISNRLSYHFNFTGPSVAVDAMCASGGLAIEQAMSALRHNSIDIAIVGAVNFASHASKFDTLREIGLLAEHGENQVFGSGDSGYVPAEAAGFLVLKRQCDIQDGEDNIHGLLLGSSCNHTGQGNGYRAPDPNAQANVMRAAMRDANVAVEQLQYLEAHSTGTRLGDQIELSAISKVLKDSNRKQALRIGSVKGNIGHPESAATLGSITKVLLQYRYAQIVQTPLFDTQIFDGREEVTKVEHVTSWPAQGGVPRIAGVSSFGAGGTNNHLVLSDFPKSQSKESLKSSDSTVLLPFSGVNEAQLMASLTRFHEYLIHIDNYKLSVELADVAYTLQVGRQHFSVRTVIEVSTLADCEIQVKRLLERKKLDKTWSSCESKIGNTTIDQASDRFKDARLWLEGALTDWPESLTTRARKISLPTHSFVQNRIWWNGPTTNASDEIAERSTAVLAELGSEQKELNVGGLDENMPNIVSIISKGIAAATNLPDGTTVKQDQSIKELRLDSISMVRFVEWWSFAIGSEFQPAWFYEARTVTELAEIVEKQGAMVRKDKEALAQSETQAADLATGVLVDSEDDNETVRLSELQQAFVFGRRVKSYGRSVSSTIYAELDLPSDFNLERMQTAFSKLIARHQMLRMKVDAGYSLVKVRNSDSNFQVTSKSPQSLKKIRDSLSCHIYDVKVWPAYKAVVANCDGKNTLHFSIDEVFADAYSVLLILKELEQFYLTGDVGSRVPQYQFTNHLQAMRSFLDTKKYKRGERYWLRKLSELPPAPNFVHTSQNKTDVPIKLLKHNLDPVVWARIKTTCTELSISPTAYFLSVFTSTIHAALKQSEMCLTLTRLGRPPIHPDINNVVGLFVSNQVYISTHRASIGEAAVAAETQLQEDSKHSLVDCLTILKKMRSMDGVSVPEIPVVFTSLLGDTFTSGSQWPVSHIFNTTPQVALDVHVHEQGDSVQIRWFVNSSFLQEDGIPQLFEKYLNSLEQAIGEQEESNEIDSESLLDLCNCDIYGEEMLELASAESQYTIQPSYAMSDLQAAYAFSRTGKFSKAEPSAAQVQVSLKNIDIERVRSVWASLVAQHPMLSASFHATGQIIPGVRSESSYELAEVIECNSQQEFDQAVATSAQHALSKPRSLESVQFFELAFVQYGEAFRMIVTVDFLIADGFSIDLLITQFLASYHGLETEYLSDELGLWNKVASTANTNVSAQKVISRTYWLDKFRSIANGPVQWLKEMGEPSQNHSFSQTLPCFSELQNFAKQQMVSVDAVLCYCYMKAFETAIAEPYSIVTVHWGRDFSGGIKNQYFGEFTELGWLENALPLGSGQSLSMEHDLQRIERNFSLDHYHRQSLQGTRVLRQFRSLSHPIVFTGLMHSPDYILSEHYPHASVPKSSVVESMSTTAGVAIDCVCRRTTETDIALHWDSKVPDQVKMLSLFNRFASLVEQVVYGQSNHLVETDITHSLIPSHCENQTGVELS